MRTVRVAVAGRLVGLHVCQTGLDDGERRGRRYDADDLCEDEEIRKFVVVRDKEAVWKRKIGLLLERQWADDHPVGNLAGQQQPRRVSAPRHSISRVDGVPRQEAAEWQDGAAENSRGR